MKNLLYNIFKVAICVLVISIGKVFAEGDALVSIANELIK